MTTYYFFDDYGEMFYEEILENDEMASEFAEKIGAEYFCCD